MSSYNNDRRKNVGESFIARFHKIFMIYAIKISTDAHI